MFHFRTNHTKPRTVGRLRVVPLFFFGFEEEEGRGRRGWEMNRRGGERESGRMEEDFERTKEDSEEDGKRTLRMAKMGLIEGEKRESGIM